MAVDISGLSKADLQKLKKKLEKQLTKQEKAPSPPINSRDPEIAKLADGIKALAKSRGLPRVQIVEAVCKRFRLKLEAGEAK